MAGKRNSEGFAKRLLSIFKTEAEEHLKNMTSGLIELEKNADSANQAQILETVFREAHSLKGAARAVDQIAIEKICQSVESVFSAMKRREIRPAPAVFDTLHQALTLLNELHLSLPEGNDAAADKISQILEKLAGIQTGQAATANDPPAPAPDPPPVSPQAAVPQQSPAVSDTLRIAVKKMDDLLKQGEELLSVKLMSDHHVENIDSLIAGFENWQKKWSALYPKICEFRRRRKTVNGPSGQPWPDDGRFFDFFDLTQNYIKTLEHNLNHLRQTVDRHRFTTEIMVNNHLEAIKRIFMLPCSTMLETFPKFVRDVSSEQAKDVELVLSGTEIEMDRRILEEMRIVLLHLLRNAIDHGIELPEVRSQNGKPRRGKITIAVTGLEGNKVNIVFSDDGKGLDVQSLKSAAIKNGMMTQADAAVLTEQDLSGIAFTSGISTSSIITDLSGRGLGLAIVREKIEKLGGSIVCQTRRHQGASFHMTLPLTLATFRGLLFTVSERQFIIPTLHVERLIRVKKDDLRTVENRDTLSLDGVAVAVVKLADILEIEDRSDPAAVLNIMVIDALGKRIAFVIDGTQNEQEVLIKSLSYPLVRVRNLAGATILGSGKVVPVLNVADLIKSAVLNKVARRTKPAADEASGEADRKSVLVAEDSITSRMLLKNILESAGFNVTTAVDGIDAMTLLKTEHFNVVISDVDMPRMNGFTLTEKIRADKKLSELPVVLVTSLESREDRERGIDVGANAYIIKSSFDQSNLLDILQRLS